MNFAHRYAGTARPGGCAFLNGEAYTGWSNPPRGYAAISNDGSTYFYRVRAGERRAFRVWATQAFQRGLSTCRITGAWPRYEANA